MNTLVWDCSELLEEVKDMIEEKLILEGEIKNDQNSKQQ